MSIWNGKQDITVIQADVVDIKAGMNVPSADSAANLLIRDVIGNKTDDHLGDSVYSLLKTINEHMHSAVKCYPTLANGVSVITGLTPWALGNYAVVVPANTITQDFDIHHINVSSFGATDTCELVLYSGADGAEVEIGRVRFTRLSNIGAPPHIPFQTSVIAANSQIKAKVANQSGSGSTAVMSILYHNY
jgi:hypothetical protein